VGAAAAYNIVLVANAAHDENDGNSTVGMCEGNR